ncbi:MAG: hypothetical protein SFW67_34680 [Myxococcaceae bacterium]|nr:hypothetical protein [Myxococcaceae bacterium]
MPSPVSTDVVARFEALRRSGITRANVRQVFREARVAGFAPRELEGFDAAARRFRDDFTPDAAVELKRIQGLRLRGGAPRNAEFALLPNLGAIEKNPRAWGASSALDPRLPTFEKALARRALPQALLERARAEGKRHLERNLGTSSRERLDGPIEVMGLYDLEHRLVGYRVTVQRSEREHGSWHGSMVTMALDGTIRQTTQLRTEPLDDR